MTALVVYGSLMAKAEISALGIHPDTAIPVIVQGYQRIFAQEPSWRKGAGNERAVLTVVRSPQAKASQGPRASFSGILLPKVDAALLRQLDVRERGYNREIIDENDIKPYNTESQWDAISAQIYVGKSHLFNENIVPNAPYQKQCLEAALEWGEDFYQAFINTTQKLQDTDKH